MITPAFSAEPFIAIAHSTRKAPEAVRLNTLDKQTPIEVGMLLCHKHKPVRNGHSLMSRESYEKKHGADGDHIAMIIAFAHQFHLSVSSILPDQRLVNLKGRVLDFERTFRISLSHYRDTKGHIFRGRTGEVYIPQAFEHFVAGVFGLDSRPVATPKFPVAKKQGRFINHETSRQSYFPASSPYVLACGGTKLTVLGSAIVEEIVWHNHDRSATGGGVSDFFPLPEYQQRVSVPQSLNTGFRGRGIPDVAANAGPETGYRVIVDGKQLVIGGTSAVAPLMAGLVARLNQQKGKPLGFFHPKLYNGSFRYRDITVGDNITTFSRKGFEAGPGWDACTGVGVVSGLK